MATLWHFENGQWYPQSLQPNQRFDAVGAGLDKWRLVPQRDAPSYSLFIKPHVTARVNGDPVGTVTVLQHGDEVQIDGRCWCFSRESRPQISVFHLEPGKRAPKCALCSNPFVEGDAIVVCPGCGRRYHQHDATTDRGAKHCFTYEPNARCCGHPTDLEGTNLWKPEPDFVTEVSRAS